MKGIIFFAGISVFALGWNWWRNYFYEKFPEITSEHHGVWIYGLGAVIFILAYESVKFGIRRLLSRFGERKRGYAKILKDALRGLMRIESLRRMANLVVHFATMRMGIRNAAAVFWNEKDKIFHVVCFRGYRTAGAQGREPHSGKISSPAGEQFSLSSPAVQYFMRKKEVLEIGRIKKLIRKEPEEEAFFSSVQEEMNRLHAVCIIPSFFAGDLRAFLILGPKKTGEPFSESDLDVLFTLAQEAAIALENAKLYDEAAAKNREIERINREHAEASKNLQTAIDNMEDANKRLRDAHAQLVHEQKMATLGRLAASVGHEVNNPLTILSMNISRMVLKYRKDPSLRVSEIADFFVKMESNIQRIKAVVNTLTGLLKKSEKGKFEPLSLKLVIEETLPLVQFQTYLDNLTGTEVEFEIPASLPLIHGNLERLQEVFLNLFTNAYHAFQGTDAKNRQIHIVASVREDNPKFVTIEFSDNGCGIEEERLQKIFNYGFTTKSEGKGSGIGLYMCRYIVELHGGEIKVTSKRGEGTTFTLTLPMFEEGKRFEKEDAFRVAQG